MRDAHQSRALKSWRYPDIQRAKETARLAVAERLQNGTISEAEGNAEFDRIEANAETEAGRGSRDAAVRAAAYEAAHPAPRRVIVE